MEKIQTYEDLLKYLVYKSREEGNPVADAYIAYLLNIQYDEQSDDFYFKDKTKVNPNKLNEIITNIKTILNAKGDGIAETLKLQITYELSHVQEEDKIEKIKKYFDNEMNNILKEITSTPASKKESETFQIHKKIFNYLLIKTKQNTLNSINDDTLTNSEKTNLGLNAEREIYLNLDNIFKVA